MADNLQASITANDSGQIIQHAHALRGAAANLSLPTLYDITDEIEALAKQGQSCAGLLKPLDEIITALENAIAELANL